VKTSAPSVPPGTRRRVTSEYVDDVLLGSGHCWHVIQRKIWLFPTRSDSTWGVIRATLQEGDELWQFSSSLKSWMNQRGHEGVELIRDGRRIGFALFRIS
jgi:hypothetical protein